MESNFFLCLFQVLYELLDDYLANHEEERKLVYRPLESTLTASVANNASCNPTPSNTNTRDTHRKWDRKKREGVGQHNVKSIEPEEKANQEGENKGGLDQCDSDVVIEEEETQEDKSRKQQQKKKKKKHNKKNKQKPNLHGSTQDTPQQIDSVGDSSLKDSAEDPEQRDTLILLSSPPELTPVDFPETPDSDHDQYNRSNVKVVPPDQLSEHDFTDDESGCSEILDYDQLREDQNFARAQWDAYQRQQEQERRGARTNSNNNNNSEGEAAPTCREITVTPSSPPSTVGQETSCDAGGEMTASANDVHSNIKYEPLESASDVKVTSNIAVSLGTVQGEGKNLDTKNTSTHVTQSKYPQGSGSDFSEIDEKLKSFKLEDNNDLVPPKVSSASCQIKHKKSVSEQIISSLSKVPQGKKCPNRAIQPSVKQETHEGNKNKSKAEKNKIRRKKKKNSATENKDGPETVKNEFQGGEVKISSETDKPINVQRVCSAPHSDIVHTPETSSISTPNTHSGHTASTTSMHISNSIKGHTPSTASANTPSVACSPGQLQRSEVVERTEPSVLQVMRLSNWEKFVQRTAVVVQILEFRNTRMAAGTLKLFQVIDYPYFCAYNL